MPKLNQDNVPCTWCNRAVPISVFSIGDNSGISKGMKITRTAYSRVNKITHLYHVFKGCFVSRTLGLDECAACAKKEGFHVFRQ